MERPKGSESKKPRNTEKEVGIPPEAKKEVEAAEKDFSRLMAEDKKEIDTIETEIETKKRLLKTKRELTLDEVTKEGKKIKDADISEMSELNSAIIALRLQFYLKLSQYNQKHRERMTDVMKKYGALKIPLESYRTQPFRKTESDFADEIGNKINRVYTNLAKSFGYDIDNPSENKKLEQGVQNLFSIIMQIQSVQVSINNDILSGNSIKNAEAFGKKIVNRDANQALLQKFIDTFSGE